MAYTTDTSPEAYDIQIELIRRMSPQERLRKAFGLSRHLKRMAFDAIRRRHPEFDDRALRMRFIQLTYGKELADELKRWLKEV